ncbi:MAG: glycosyltransferase family 39 protein, partial [Bacteroidota bacterium]
KFQIIRYLLISVTLIFIAAALKLYRQFEKNTLDMLSFIANGLRAEISNISRKDWYLFSIVFVFATLIKAYYFFTQPITNDEAFTFLSYVNQGVAASASYYNLTNNHILHSLLCNVFNLLPVSPVYSLRIASFLTGSVTLFIVFIFFRKLFDIKAVFMAFVFFAFAPASIQYGFLARGYSLILLFTTISTFALFELIKYNENKKKLWFIFIISSALGFYSIPVYLYVFASHITFYFIYSLTASKFLLIKNIKELFIASLIVGLVVSILYSPVMLVSGFDSLVGNDVIKSLSTNEFMFVFVEFIPDYIQWVFGYNMFLISVAFVVIPIGLIYSYKKRRDLFLIIISFLIVPIILIFIQRITLYNRLFVFVVLFMGMVVGLFTELILKKFEVKKILSDIFLYSSATILALLLLVGLNNQCKQQKLKNNMAYNFADKVENNSTIFSTNEVRYYTFLKFKAMFLDKKEIELFREDFDKNFAYDYISETKEEGENFVAQSKYNYSIAYEDEFIRLYKRE